MRFRHFFKDYWFSMKIEDIYVPIQDDLVKVDSEIKSLLGTYQGRKSSEMLSYFFDNPGKYLRPALVIFSARAASLTLFDQQYDQMIKLATVVELVHSASLIHDDIIDADQDRRGRQTLNHLYGNSLSVLSGDLLFSKAFYLLAKYLPVDFSLQVTSLAEKMCVAEIDQAVNPVGDNLQDYLRLIEGKTASFMQLCMNLGASLTTTDVSAIDALTQFGYHFGMTYQIVDDHYDQDSFINTQTDPIHEHYVGHAVEALARIEQSDFQLALSDLLKLIVSGSHQ